MLHNTPKINLNLNLTVSELTLVETLLFKQLNEYSAFEENGLRLHTRQDVTDVIELIKKLNKQRQANK
jgi:hypothetical protein